MKKEISIFKQNLYSNIINGVAWCLFGVTNLFDNLPCKILSLIFMSVAVFASFRTMIGKREEDDEMSLLHKRHAESSTLHLMLLVVCLVGLVSILWKDINIPVNQAYPFVLGFAELYTGFLFMHFEKVGD